MGAEPWGKMMPLNSPVSGSKDGRELFPWQESMDTIQSGWRQEQWEQPNFMEDSPAQEVRQCRQPKTSGTRREGKNPAAKVPQAALLLLQAQIHFLTLASANTHIKQKQDLSNKKTNKPTCTKLPVQHLLCSGCSSGCSEQSRHHQALALYCRSTYLVHEQLGSICASK